MATDLEMGGLMTPQAEMVRQHATRATTPALQRRSPQADNAARF
jgi:hypothetical protein